MTTQATKNIVDALAEALTSKMIDHDIETGISTVATDPDKKKEIKGLLEKFRTSILKSAGVLIK